MQDLLQTNIRSGNLISGGFRLFIKRWPAYTLISIFFGVVPYAFFLKLGDYVDFRLTLSNTKLDWVAVDTEFPTAAIDFLSTGVVLVIVTVMFAREFSGDRNEQIVKPKRFFKVAVLGLGTYIVGSAAIGCGYILFIIPGIILNCVLWIGLPIAVIERTNPLTALKRSAALTKGFRLEIFFVWLFLIFAGAIIGQLIEFLIQTLPERLSEASSVTYVNNIGVTFARVVTAVFFCHSYHRLIIEKEQLTVSQVAEIFR